MGRGSNGAPPQCRGNSTREKVPLSWSTGWWRHDGRAVFSGDVGEFVDDPVSAGAVPGQADLVGCYVVDGDMDDVGAGVEGRHRPGQYGDAVACGDMS